MTMRILLLSLAVYGLSLALPCLSFVSMPTELTLEQVEAGKMSLDTFGNSIIMRGLELTISGAFGLVLFWQVAAVGWLANPLYWGSAVLFGRQQYMGALLIAGLAVGVGGLGTLLAFRYSLPAGSTPYTQLALQQLLVGFWLWLTAPAIVAIGSTFYLFSRAS